MRKRPGPFEPPPAPPWVYALAGAIGGFYFAEILARYGLLGVY